MPFRGLNCIWGNHNPPWLEQLTPEGKRQALVDHITAVVGNFGTDVVAYDLVIEAASKNEGKIYKNTVWYPDVPDYVDLAYLTAHEVNPNVKLFYSEYNADSAAGWQKQKADNVYLMMQGMLNRGIPIDGVGL